jgi:hypothetical protein
MELVWSPEGQEPRTFVFTPRKLTTVDAEAIENVGGMVWSDFDTFVRLFNANNRRALRAALWLCLSRDDPSSRFESLSVGVYEISVQFGDDEREIARRILTSGEDVDPVQREFYVSLLGDDPGAADPKASPEPSDSQPELTE